MYIHKRYAITSFSTIIKYIVRKNKISILLQSEPRENY